MPAEATTAALVTSRRPSAEDPDAPLARRSPYGRWRAFTLILVYVLMAAHVVHWQWKGRTLAPLELHEVMFTAELGIVTAGFLFMALAIVATGIFGRFFCGWACHMMALQELCAWILRKLGIRRKPIRARLIAWAPFAVMLYMFVLPQVERIAAGRPHPGFRITSDTEAIGSFSTGDFWRNLPDPWIAALTFLVCGFLAVYVLGSRGFCTYACPYGVLFRAVDRIAPGKVRVTGKCEQCGTCTKVCASGIPVHEELARHGAVLDPRCMKDLDCVGACPHDAISFAYGRPLAFARRPAGAARKRLRFDFTIGEELLMAAAFAGTLLIFRGLYNQIPFLMSVGLGAASSYVAVVCLRLLMAREVSFGKAKLKSRGRLRTGGLLFGAVSLVFFLFAGHCAVVQYSLWRGRSLYAEAKQAADGEVRAAAVAASKQHLDRVERWALFPMVEPKWLLAWDLALEGDPRGAEGMLRAALEVEPRHAETRYYLAGFLAQRGDRGGAISELRTLLAHAPRHVNAHLQLGRLLEAQGATEEARREFEMARELDPTVAGGP
ncbi:MAG: hypothetical protein Fur0037_24000 [Planctomycetota bacterium]